MYLKSLDKLKEYIQDINVDNAEELMILVGEKSAEHIDDMNKYLNTLGIKFFGGIYPRLLINNISISEGFIVEKYKPIYSKTILPNLMRFKEKLDSSENYTAIIIVDGLSSKMKDLIDTVYNKLGTSVKYIGGGAGYYDMRQRPVIFNNNGIEKDALHICVLKSDIKLAVRHGWEILDGPFYVTESQENTLISLDNYSALDIYRDVMRDAEGISLSRLDFFTYAKDHPFGIKQKGDEEMIVRDPIAIDNDNAIICVAGIPQNSESYILKGDAESLLESSMKIVDECIYNQTEK